MKLRILSLLLFLCSFTIIAQTDTYTLKGKVVSEADNMPIIGANVLVTAKSKGTSTDFDGNFTLEVTTDDVITVSYVGFNAQTFIISGQNNVTVQLSEDLAKLDEVVVVAYGTQKKSSLTGSVSSLDNENLDELPYSRVDQALQGKIAGVQIQNVSSEIGESPQITIRGLSSISANSSPLVVVDGFPIADALEFINPSSIKSIEVLKDASSTALYGSR